MEEEIWKQIPGFNGYEVSDAGNVRSYRRRNGISFSKHPSVLKPGKNSRGYKFVLLRREGITFNFSVHKLVMLSFVGKYPEGMEICHNNGNPSDNRLSNLRYDTHKENIADAIRHGRIKKRDYDKWIIKNSNSSQRSEIRKYICNKIIEMHENGMSYSAISRITNYTISAISRIVNGNRRPYLKQ